MIITVFDKILTKQQFYRKNTKLFFTEPDTFEKCLDKTWFTSYKKDISYEINNIGFRDDNVDILENQIYVIGDSFSMGIGQPYEETWPCLLEKKLNKRIIKLTSHGAGNDWMMSVFDIIKNYKPIAVFLMLSYVSRKCIFKENNVKHELYDKEQLFDKNFLTNLEKNYKSQVNYLTKETREKNINFLYTGVPDFCKIANIDYKNIENIENFISYKRLNHSLKEENLMKILKKNNDIARDGLHFGHVTSESIAENFYIRYNELYRKL